MPLHRPLSRPTILGVTSALTVAAASSGFALASAAAPAAPASISSVRPGSTAAASPQPGAKYATSHTEISFRGVPASSVRNVTVKGSTTGYHSGRILADRDGQGASFVPSKAFAPGETVSVTTPLHVFNATNGDFTFTVGRGTRLTLPPLPISSMRAQTQSFHSEPNLHPPVLTTTKGGTGSYGDLFTSPYGVKGLAGNEITDQSDQVVYYAPARTGLTDFRVQTYHGKPVLTWWQGSVINPGFGRGHYVIADTSYHVIKTVYAGNGLSGDAHEFLITPQNTALITSYAPTSTGTDNVLDGVVQEVEIDSGRVLFEWHALDHIALTDSYVPSGGLWDVFHINSVQPYGGNRLLLSLRSTHQIVAISKATGAVSFTIGGKHSSVHDTTLTHSQHDAEPHADGTITVFDNGAGAGTSPHRDSRGLVLRVSGNSLQVVRQLRAPDGELAYSQGNVQSLQGGYLVDFGSTGVIAEYDSAGHLTLVRKYQRLVQTYRAYRAVWHATPTTVPAVATMVAGGQSTTWVSWNGATEVASWRVLSGSSASSLSTVTTATKKGFETAIAVPATGGVEQVQALDSSGRVLATSRLTTIG